MGSLFPSAIGPTPINKLPLSVADPGFPVGGGGGGGRRPVGGDANLQGVHLLVKTYAKTKEIDPVGGGGGRRRRPPPWIRQCLL